MPHISCTPTQSESILCVHAANQQQPRRRLPQVQPPPPGVRAFAPSSKHEQVQAIREQLEAGQFEEVCVHIICPTQAVRPGFC